MLLPDILIDSNAYTLGVSFMKAQTINNDQFCTSANIFYSSL
jgi:hypothetical protein